MTQLELQKEIENYIPIHLPCLNGFGIDDKTVVVAAFGLKGMISWSIKNGTIKTIRGLRTKAKCIEAHPNAGESILLAEDELGTQLTFNLSSLVE